jgi:hypothetical protein
MTDAANQVIEQLDQEARAGFPKGAFRTDPLGPREAAGVLRRIPPAHGFDGGSVAAHVERLKGDGIDMVRFGRTAAATFLTVSLSGDRRAAFEWADATLQRLGATSVKMNLGPGKPTDAKIFWGKPDINTLIEIGGEGD